MRLVHRLLAPATVVALIVACNATSPDVDEPRSESSDAGSFEHDAGPPSYPPACDPDSDGRCSSNTECCNGDVCVDGRCESAACKRPGDTCDPKEGGCCSGLCEFGVCRKAPGRQGDPCTTDDECYGKCESGRCFDCMTSGSSCGQGASMPCCDRCDFAASQCVGTRLTAARAECKTSAECRSKGCQADPNDPIRLRCLTCRIAGSCTSSADCCSNECVGGVCTGCFVHGQVIAITPDDEAPVDAGASKCCDGSTLTITPGHPDFDKATVTCCTRKCDGNTCGPDGCGGTCGTCAPNDDCIEKDGHRNCQPCVPQCNGRTCGSDGCGGTCGTCTGTDVCSAGGKCEPCVPKCGASTCGGDGCGGSCGSCSFGQKCYGLPSHCCSPSSCAGRECGNDGCGGSCGTCPAGSTCAPGFTCQPICGRAGDRCTGAGSVDCCAGYSCGVASGNFTLCCGQFGRPCSRNSDCCNNICSNGTCAACSGC